MADEKKDKPKKSVFEEQAALLGEALDLAGDMFKLGIRTVLKECDIAVKVDVDEDKVKKAMKTTKKQIKARMKKFVDEIFKDDDEDKKAS